MTALGVEIATNTRVENLTELRRAGYDAILLATGAPISTRLGVPGEDLDGVVAGLDFLEAVKRGEVSALRGKRAVIVGGGNVAMDAARTARRLSPPDVIVAMDAARTARRLGAPEVIVAYRRGREEMPAHLEEVEAAEQEGTRFQFQVVPVEVVGEDGRVSGLRCIRTRLGEPDASGRRRPEPVPGSEFLIECESVITAVGLTPEAMALAPEVSGDQRHGPGRPGHAADRRPLPVRRRRRRVRRARHRERGRPGAAGRRHDRPLAAGPGPGRSRLRREAAGGGQGRGAGQAPRRHSRCEPRPQPQAARLIPTPRDFESVEPPLTEQEARHGAQRCLDCGVCSECRQCVAVCEADAIDLSMRERDVELEVGAIIAATGFKPFDPKRIPEYGYGTYPNVYTSLEVERLLNASGPTQGEMVLRTGGRPRSVGIIHCVGSRDVRYNSYCSRVCCMYSLKLAHLLKERTDADIYNFYIDMRTPGKGYEEFYGKVGKEGVHFIRGRVAEVSDWTLTPEEAGKLVIRAEDTLASTVRRIPVDMVVLAVALEPQADADQVGRMLNISCGSEGWFTERHPKLAPVSTFTDGVFLAGVCQGPKDIPDTVAQAGAAAAEVLALVDRGSVELEPRTAFVDPDKCSGCRTCIGLCPFGALSFDPETNTAMVNEVLCKGCGVCVAACPAGARQQHLFTDEQILAELKGVLEGA